MPLTNWPPLSFEPPVRQSDRLSGVMILADDLLVDRVAVLSLVVLDEDLGGPVGHDPELHGAVEGDGKPSDERKSIADPSPRLNRFDRQSTRLIRAW